MDANSDAAFSSGGSDADYATESEPEIDPDLPIGRSSTHSILAQFQDLDLSDDDYNDDFPEPVLFSDDDADGNEGHDDLQDGYTLRDNLKVASGFKVRKKPKSTQYLKRRLMRATDKNNDPEVRDNLSKANEAFVRQDLSTAWKHYMEVIKLDPKNFNAYKTLGEISLLRNNWNKCCTYWLLAAECGEADADFWAKIGGLSADLGHVDQAIHCYGQAIAKLEWKEPEFIVERAVLYRLKKQFGRALEGLQKGLQVNPTDPLIIKQFANVYVDQNRLSDAVALYGRVLESNMNPIPGVSHPPFNWTELNIVCELLQSQQNWRAGVSFIRVVSRWKQRREDETWWDIRDDDVEYDVSARRKVLMLERPSQCKELMKRDFDLPIDIRFKLGIFRLELEQKDEALAQFLHLYAAEDVQDLFFDAGCALEEKGCFTEAIEYLSSLYSIRENLEIGMTMGKCFLAIEDYENARDILLETLKLDPDNVELKVNVIEALYYTEDMEKAEELMKDISTEIAQKKNSKEQEDSTNNADEPGDSALIKNSKFLKKREKDNLSEEDQMKIEENATRLVVSKFTRMEGLQKAVDQGHQAAATAWLKIASQLIEMFMEVRSFFPKNRKTPFRGVTKYRKKKAVAIDDQMDRLRNLLGGLSATEESRTILSSKSEFRGLSYDTWLYVFVQSAYVITQFERNIDEAIRVVDLALEVSVFIQDKMKSTLLRIARLVLGIYQQDYAITVSNNVRYLLTSAQFSPIIYNFFMCCFGSGVAAWAAFSNYNHQKYFLRHLKAFDSLLTNTKVSGAAQISIDANSHVFNREHPNLLYIYACLLGSNRAYSSPIVYLTRAYRQYYNDPTICFMLGLAHVHRSMQRNSINRHIQLLQGISYLMEYRTARLRNATDYEKQEVEYNFGRLFHMIGLTSLAVKHYENVLSFHDALKHDHDYDMLTDAAYNLTLIYTINGNTELSRNICEKYLTI